MFRNISIKNYSHLLEQENEALKRKISRLENERDRAITEKVRMSELLEKYKGEYEALIADTKKLIGKQRESEKVVDGIMARMRDELSQMLQGTTHNTAVQK